MQSLEVIGTLDQDQDSIALRSTVAGIAAEAQALRIADDESLRDANELGSAATGALKRVDARRRFFVDPLNAHVKKINETFRALSEPLQVARDVLAHKIGIWRSTEQRRIDDERRNAEASARAEEAKAREKEAAAEAARL